MCIRDSNLNALKEMERRRAVDKVKELVDEAYLYGAKILVLCSGPDPGESKRSDASASLIKSLKEICNYAIEKAKGYTLAISLETFDREIDKRLFMGPTWEAVGIAKEVMEEYENFGLTLDLSHLPLLGENPVESVRIAGDYLNNVHLGNCVLRDLNHPQYGDKHPPLCIEGGEVCIGEVKAFLRALRDVGYFDKETPTTLPTVMFEVRPRAGEDPQTVINASKRLFIEAWTSI